MKYRERQAIFGVCVLCAFQRMVLLLLLLAGNRNQTTTGVLQYGLSGTTTEFVCVWFLSSYVDNLLFQ